MLEVLLGEALQLEAAADLVGADEPAVVLELGRGRDRARHRLVGDGDAEAPALELDQAVADEALEHLLLEPHLAQHVLVEPALVEPVVHLALAAVGPLELTDRDGQPAHLHHRLPRRALPCVLQGGDVQDDEGGDHQPQEDVEPAPVAAHQGESHAVSSRTFAKSRFYAPLPPPASRAARPAWAACGVDLYSLARLSCAGSGDLASMASDEKQPPRGSGDRIEWFTVSYRTLALAGGAILLLAALGWFLFLRRTPPPPPPATAIETGARFAKIDGSVQVKRAGTLEWLPATLAVVLRQNDLVRTGSGAAAEIHFADGTVFNVRPDSLITIEESSQNPVSRQQRVGALHPVRGGQLPDGGAQRARQHHDLDADRAHHRGARHRGQHPGGGGRRDGPAHLQGPGRGRDPRRPEDRARLERGSAGWTRPARRARSWRCPRSRSSRRPPTGPTSPTRTSRRASRSCCGARCRRPRPTA